jgi:hypothetical protein
MRIFITKQLREDKACSGIFSKQIVFIAPQPLLSRLRRNDHGVLSMMEVFCHVPVAGLIATEGDPAGLAGTEVYPVVAHLDAFFADVFFGLLQLFDRLYVLTDRIGHIVFLLVIVCEPRYRWGGRAG